MLSLVGKQLKSLKENQLGNVHQVRHLDVSSNELSIGRQFNPLVSLITLVIDDNLFNSLTDFPVFTHLETFSANKNNFSDLTMFIEESKERFGNLKNLSLLKNPLNPFFEGEHKYFIYRDLVLVNYPDLKTIDGCAVTIMRKNIIDKQKSEQAKYEKLQGYAVYDQKYAIQQVKSVKGRSQGNRYLKNDQL